MNWKVLAKVGLKVVVTLAAGYAAWKGIERVTNPKPQPTVPSKETSEIGNAIMEGLHTASSTCNKINAVMGAVTATSDAIYTIFGNQNQPYGYQATGFRRSSPLIVETNRCGINTQGYRY